MFELLKKNIFFIVIGVIVIAILFITKDDDDTNHSELTEFSTLTKKDGVNKSEDLQQVAMVDIKGEINKPGVYELKIDSRVIDVINLAEGFTETADQTVINLAQKVQDEMIIIVPGIGEVASGTAAGNSNEKIRINYASQQELETLNGIGPSKAQAIIQHREENGFFQKVEDLLEISGIGQKTLEKIQDDIQIP